MSPTVIGLFTGLALGFAAAFGGLGALAIVALLALLGALAGRFAGGDLDLSVLTGAARSRSPR